MQKLTFFFFLILIVQTSLAQKNIQAFNSMYSLTHAVLQEGQICLVNDKLNGGGIFQVREKGNFIIDSGIVFPTINSSLVLVRSMDKPGIVYMQWFGVKDSTHNFMPAFNKATAYLKTKGGGAIIFDAGTFTSRTVLHN